MDTKIHVSLPAIFKPMVTIPPLAIKASDVSNPTNEAGAKVTISDAARRFAKSDAAGEMTKVEAPEAIRDLLEGIDFRSITPRQMAVLGGQLFERGYLSMQVASSFNGVELDTVVEKSPDEQMDMIKHFGYMLDVITEAAKSDVTLNYAMTRRTDAMEALKRLASYTRAEL